MPFEYTEICGNVGRDPERHQGQNGEVATFSVAVNNQRNPDAEPNWYKCVVGGSYAQVVLRGVRKGGKVVVHGTPAYEVYTRKDGELRVQITLFARTVELVSDGQRAPGDERPTRRDAPQQQQSARAPQPPRAPGGYANRDRQVAPQHQAAAPGRQPPRAAPRAPQADDFLEDDDLW